MTKEVVGVENGSLIAPTHFESLVTALHWAKCMMLVVDGHARPDFLQQCGTM